MENPILINSANVSEFGFRATFNLETAKLQISWAPHTIFKGLGNTLIQSVAFQVTDPSAVLLLEQTIPQPLVLTDIEIPLSASFLFGYYTIEAILTEATGREYKIRYTKEICQPAGWSDGFVKGSFDVAVNCYDPSIQISETTALAYKHQRPDSVQQAGVLYYPDLIVEALPFAFSPFVIGQTDGIYTGNYTIRNITRATYDLEDGFYIIIPYKTSKDFPVDCNSSLSDVLCCLTDVQGTAQDFNSVAGKQARQRMDLASPYVMVAVMKEMTGKNAGKEVKKIRSILNCDCGCGGTQSVAPRLIGGTGSLLYTVTGEGGTTVTSSLAGSTRNFKVSSKVVSVTKYDPADTAFSILKTESNLGVNYAFAFNYTQLAQTILTTIAGDETLKEFFNEIVTAAGALDLTQLDGKCVITLTDESTIEQILQAIVNYLCTLSTLKVKLGLQLEGMSINAKGAVADKTYEADALLSDYLKDLNAVMKAFATSLKATFLNCANIKAAFPATAKPILPAEDFLYGTKTGECARLSYKDLFSALMSLAKSDKDMKALLCEVVATCNAVVCAAPQNVSAYLDYETFTATRQANFTKNNC